MSHASVPLLQVFAREPVPGAVKTRLAAAIGDAAAAAVYRELTTVTLAHAREAQQAGIVSAVELWCTPVIGSPWFSACAEAADASLHLQTGTDLGARMQYALDDGLTRADAVLLVGTDCPVLDVDALMASAAALGTADAILVPAEDGGFVLVGSRVCIRFDGVRMSSPHTAADARANFARDGIRCSLLPTSWDVDDAADLARWQRMQA